MMRYAIEINGQKFPPSPCNGQKNTTKRNSQTSRYKIIGKLDDRFQRNSNLKIPPNYQHSNVPNIRSESSIMLLMLLWLLFNILYLSSILKWKPICFVLYCNSLSTLVFSYRFQLFLFLPYQISKVQAYIKDVPIFHDNNWAKQHRTVSTDNKIGPLCFYFT